MKLLGALLFTGSLLTPFGLAQAESVHNVIFPTRAQAEAHCEYPDIVQPYYNLNFELEGYVCLDIHDPSN